MRRPRALTGGEKAKGTQWGSDGQGHSLGVRRSRALTGGETVKGIARSSEVISIMGRYPSRVAWRAGWSLGVITQSVRGHGRTTCGGERSG